jgi:hypothetical protein
MQKLIWPVLSCIIIPVLSASLGYKIVQRQQDSKRDKQFFIALGVQFYLGLQQGEVDAVKRRLGGDGAANAILYEQQYGEEAGTKFAMRLSQAKVISAELHATKP